MNLLKKSSFIAICGSPNVGKSTILNHIIGKKVSIVSHKAQTTRSRLCGILTEGDTQLVIMDIPGIFEAKSEFEDKIVKSVKSAIRQCTVILVVIDASRGLRYSILDTLDELLKHKKEIIIAINKIDISEEERLFELIQRLSKYCDYDKIVQISALNGDGMAELKEILKRTAIEDHWYYDPSDITDRNISFLASEITREKLFHKLHEELPYSLHVKTESISHTSEDLVEVNQIVYVQRDSQKYIVIGKNGKMINDIAYDATQDMINLFNKKVKLFISVETNKDWVRECDWNM